jgi:hypothetical protein
MDASSGEQNRHRLSRAGNRRVNHMIHIAAVTQLRHDPTGQAYYRRKRSENKKPMEAMRCLKRRISRRRVLPFDSYWWGRVGGSGTKDERLQSHASDPNSRADEIGGDSPA